MRQLAALLGIGVLAAAGPRRRPRHGRRPDVPPAGPPQTTRDAPIPHGSGQSVTPAYEGWFPNADGTFSLSFGYFNRNYETIIEDRERAALATGGQ